jgi:hypothetical protein
VAADLVQFVGYAVLTLVTLGSYQSKDDGLFLEGVIGLFILATLFYLMSKLVL